MWQKKAELPDYQWADRVDLLRDYFEPSDFEWDAYRRIFGTQENLKLIHLPTLCANFVMPIDEPTIGDYISGEYKNILWNYALAALVCRSCEEP